ncbi:HPP family protein [Microcoleus sp. S13_C5]|uniref:HPP family protein n=1 Tax=Microcoleus sp. S13_C5 TaxID=3055411 RepID=UPI002FD65A92
MSRTEQENHSSSQQKRRWPASVPDKVWAPLGAGGLILVVGLIGLLAGQPWLFPSLGPTAFLQVETPDQRSARFYNTVVGHLLGLGAGLLAVTLLGAGDAPAVLSTKELTPVRVWAAAIAIALNMLGGLLLRASHPPAAATTLLVALGGFKPTVHDTLTVIIGVLIVATVGEVLRRIRLGKVPSHLD